MALKFAKVNLVVIFIIATAVVKAFSVKVWSYHSWNYYNVVKVTQNFEFYSAEDGDTNRLTLYYRCNMMPRHMVAEWQCKFG